MRAQTQKLFVTSNINLDDGGGMNKSCFYRRNKKISSLIRKKFFHHIEPTKGSQRCILREPLSKTGRNWSLFQWKVFIFHLFRKSDLWNNERLPLLYVILFRIIFLHIFFQFGVPLPKHNYSLPSRKNFDFILLFILTRLGSGCSQTSVPLNLVEN